MFYVYILKLKNGTYYNGFSHDLKNRYKEHCNNEVHQTIDKNPKLVFYAVFESKIKALDFEKYLKSSSGFAFRNKRLL